MARRLCRRDGRASADLDLTKPPGALSPPLAFAFYWVRWLPPEGLDTKIFLPGFKADQIVDVPIVPGDRVGGNTWHVPLRTDWFSDHPESSATATTSPDRHLLRLAFELHGSRGSARGLIEQQGCAGEAVAPSEDPR